jgi:hypothetical protein
VGRHAPGLHVASPQPRRDGYRFELVYGVEPNPRGTGHHAHGWLRGDKIPRTRLQDRAWQAGMGRVSCQPVTYSGNFAYPMKLATWNEPSLAAYRAANGPQILHATKPFWTDARSGEVLNRDQAIARSRRCTP